LSDVVLIHAGIADSRMWAPQLQSFARDRRVIAPDLPGFGTATYESDVVDFRATIRDAMDAADMQRAALVGTSFGGMIALDFALESPERVSALVLVGPGIDDHDWSNELEELDNAEVAALERGDIDEAVDTQMAWVTGPARSRDAVDQRLGEISVPTLVVTGDEDFDDIRRIGDRLVAEVPGAERATIAHTAHLPSLERPAEFDRIVLGFLAKHGV
jgi:3-oxoadipate enol-lactonase